MQKIMGKNLWLRARPKANLKLELKMKVVENTCDKELGTMKTASKVHLKTCKSHFLLEKFMSKI